MTGRNDDQMQKKEEKELAAIKKRQRIMNERTEKIERENEELKRLTKGLFEARKKQKNLNKKFAQLRQNDNVRVTIQAIVHSKAQQVRDSIEYSER
jgi:K+/H+ antiporter YhaU regulatory subunit KhtT